MVNHLPAPFVEKMKRLLGPEFAGFLASYDDPRWYGLRVNTLKVQAAEFLKLSPFELTPIPWTETGFYYEEKDRPGKHPYYHAGLYYIQEPSAMAPAELLGVQPGDRVLDLCAAPGGKSTQIAAKLEGQGVLVVNDIHPDRVKALVKNLELAGVRNAVVLNEQPEKLTGPFAGYFDKILVDAPCSGEGMFRKEEDMAKEWEPDDVRRYASMQRELIAQAASMLKPGGRLVYSTCTFSPEENEAIIAEFIDGHPHFAVEPIPPEHGLQRGRPDWLAGLAEQNGQLTGAPAERLSASSIQAAAGTARLWPHHLRGEGHFVAALRKTSSPKDESYNEARPAEPERLYVRADRATAGIRPDGKSVTRGKATRKTAPEPKRKTGPDMEPMYAFWREHVRLPVPGRIAAFGDHLYAAPPDLPDLSGIRVIRPGWYLGAIHKQRFEPSHALAMGLKPAEFARTVSLSSDSAEAIRYLKGETLELPQERIEYADGLTAKGHCLVCIDGFTAGWGKWVQDILKNEYPPGWRWT
ncbi:RsmB/NOP family class I SAM-dependent RNA methyltransferase [Paenibacillus hamazuiensis]|uniref:RsmB/NOP family class I SAM-dependent RNA methyltransferase n=1 Tax=Paenibacillus hamazuiensis TaxID=2936508 RepID=UPI00200F2DAA|nr:RsmB/NOP family class I SAM-dependent RNA methyltransferase [Paenibacillus hamazuiensis]